MPYKYVPHYLLFRHHVRHTETVPVEPDRTVTEYSNGDTPFLACFCLGVFLVFAFVIICYNLNKK